MPLCILVSTCCHDTSPFRPEGSLRYLQLFRAEGREPFTTKSAPGTWFRWRTMQKKKGKERKKKQACVYTRLCFLSAVTHTQTVFAQGEYTHIFPHMGSNGGKESRWERGGFTLLQMEVCHKNVIWKLGRVGWQGRVQWKCGFPNQLSLYLFIYLSLIDAVSAVVTHPFNYTLPPWIKYFHVKSIGGPIFGFFCRPLVCSIWVVPLEILAPVSPHAGRQWDHVLHPHLFSFLLLLSNTYTNPSSQSSPLPPTTAAL